MNFGGGKLQYLLVFAVTCATWCISESVPIKTVSSLPSSQNYTDEFHTVTTPKPLSELKHRVRPFVWWYTVPPDDVKYSDTEVKLSIYMPIVIVTLVCFLICLLIRKHCILARNRSARTRIISLSSTVNRQASRNPNNAGLRRNEARCEARCFAARHGAGAKKPADKPPDYFEVVNTDQKKYPAVPPDTLQIPPPKYGETEKY